METTRDNGIVSHLGPSKPCCFIVEEPNDGGVLRRGGPEGVPAASQARRATAFELVSW